MNSLINLFVRRPVTVIMILSALIIAAVYSLLFLPVNKLPEISVPGVVVETVYPGMTANEVRNLVTIPLEDGFSSVKGLEKIRSVSRDNRSLISMDFRWGTDPMAASVLVREAVDAVYPSLPEGVRKPMVTGGDSASSSNINELHAVIAVSAHNENEEDIFTGKPFLRNIADYDLRARLRRIDGVGSIVLVGGDVAEEKLFLDIPRLAALGISPSEFVQILAQETVNIPAGNAKEGNLELVIVSSGKPDSVYDLKNIILPVTDGTFTVQDAGSFSSSTARRESAFVYDGKEAVALEIYRRPGSDPVRLSRDIKKAIDEAADVFSRNAEIKIIYDSTPSLVSGIKSLMFSAFFSVAAVVIVLFLFIRSMKYSLLASFAIPFSIAAGICVLSVSGRSLNSMSLAGLAMGIGLVSDISVIILDILHRSFGKLKTIPEPHEIGNKAASIAGSGIASTLTTALVFVPVILLPGVLGSLFGDLAIALVSAVAAGWFYAQLCLPSLYRMFHNKEIIVSPEFYLLKKLSVFTNGSLEKKYSHFLKLLFHHPEKVFFIVLVMVAIGIVCLLSRPMVFINPDEAEEINISFIMPPGTLLDTAEKTGKRVSKTISGLPFVKTVFGRAGAEEEDSGRRADINYMKEEFILRCILEKKAKPEKVLAEIKKIMSLMYDDLLYSVYFPKDRTEVLLGLSSERTFVVSAKDRAELSERLSSLKDIFSKADLDDLEVNFRPLGKRPELRLYPNREAAAFLSIPASFIAESLFVLNEGVVTTSLEIEGRPLDVRVTGENINNDNPVRRLEEIPLKTPQGKTVLAGSLGRIEREDAEYALARLNRNDVLYADISAEKKLPSFVKKLAARFPWFSSADESVFTRYKNTIFLYVILVLVLLYMTMGAQFESFLLPVILMLSIPFSLAGAGPALLLSGSRIDAGAVLGLTALFGLVVNNSLILFEISDEKIRAGLSPAEGVKQGAEDRLQAILITTATTVFALFPLIVSPMANSQKSMAAAMLGGLAVSSFLSLFALPPVLVKYFEWKIRKEAK